MAADVALADHKTVGPLFRNEEQHIRVLYDFDEDTGESDDSYFIITAAEDLIITDFWIRGITTFDSAGDGASIDVGIDGGDEDVLIDGLVEASVAADAINQPVEVEGAPNVGALPLLLAEDGVIQMIINTEDLTSGKCEFNFVVRAAS